MPLVVRCDYCGENVTEYHKIHSYEDGALVYLGGRLSAALVCFSCVHKYCERLGKLPEV